MAISHAQALEHEAKRMVWIVKIMSYLKIVFSIFVIFASIYLFVEVGKHEDGSVKMFGNISASITLIFSLFIIGFSSYVISGIDHTSPYVQALTHSLLKHKTNQEIINHVNEAGAVSHSPEIAKHIHKVAATSNPKNGGNIGSVLHNSSDLNEHGSLYHETNADSFF